MCVPFTYVLVVLPTVSRIRVCVCVCECDNNNNNNTWTTATPLFAIRQLQHLTSTALVNNTPRAQLDTLFFNRVPKAGSEKLLALLQQLAKRNKFQARRDPRHLYETILMDTGFARHLLEAEILNCSTANSYTKHMAFLISTLTFGQPGPFQNSPNSSNNCLVCCMKLELGMGSAYSLEL